MIPSHVRAVFFDAVGTLIHPSPGAVEVYCEYAHRRGVDLSPATVRPRLTDAYLAEEQVDESSGWVTSEQRERDRWRQIVAASLPEVADIEVCFEELFLHFARPDAWRVDADASTVFTDLTSRGVIVGMGSNYDARLLSVVAGTPELAPVAGRVVVSSLVGVRKPGQQFFDELCRVTNYPAEQIAFVGDDYRNDYVGASDAGLFAVLLDDRNRHPNVRRVRSLNELVR